MYQNYVHVEGKALLCMNNYAARDRLFSQPEQISRLLFSSDDSPRREYEGLEAIWRIKIANVVTQNLISGICRGNDWAPVDGIAGEDNFFALLATDHGKGPTRMLAAYPEGFGHRFIARARIFPRGQTIPDLCWFLEEIVLCTSLLAMYVVVAQRINGGGSRGDVGEFADEPRFNPQFDVC